MGFSRQNQDKPALEKQGGGDKWQNTWAKGHYQSSLSNYFRMPRTHIHQMQMLTKLVRPCLGLQYSTSFPLISSGLMWVIDIGLLHIKDKQTSLAPLTQCSHLNDSLTSFSPHSLWYVLWKAFGSNIQ